MPYEWLSTAFGGGPLGAIFVLLAIVVVAFYWNLLGQIKDRRTENAELRAALSRLTDVVESWTPEAQKRRLPRR